jgi:predicted negative regulator of RcsB-dependent stress response
MAILTLLVIATIIITGVFVGYHAWQDSLHEKPEKHSAPELETFQSESSQMVVSLKPDLTILTS